MPPFSNWAAAKYMSSATLNTSTVRKVSLRSNCALKVRSVMVINDTSAVFFSNSISRLPAGGSISGTAWGTRMRHSVARGVMFSATAASACPLGTLASAPRTTSAP